MGKFGDKMHKLIEFLSNEMPDYADELISALNTAAESVGNIRDAITDMIPTLWKQRERRKDINDYDDMDKELECIESYLKSFLSDMDSTILSNIDAKLDEIIEEEENETESSTTTVKIDYNKYLVDKTVPYKLLDDFKNTSPYAFTFDGIQYLVDSWYEITIKVCEILYKRDKDLFSDIAGNCGIKGRKNAYIAFKNEYPARTIAVKKQLLNTDIVIEQRLSANQHMIVVKRLLDKFHIPRTAIEIFLESDRKPLHGQQPIGKYINDITYKENISQHGLENTDDKPDIKIGKYAKDFFEKYFSSRTRHYNISNFLNKDWCHDKFGICYPLLKEVDMSIPISKQKGYNNEYGRYWIKPILEINDSYYILCSQWFEEFREKLDKWIEEQETQISDSKMNVYVLQKLKTKTCPKCGNRTEKEILYVTYSTSIADINNKLFTRRCNTCDKTYIADTIFRSYTKSKDIENINVNFINHDT